MYQISREKMPELLAAVAKEMDLFLPVQNNGITNFGFWTEDADVDLDTLKTVKSPKDAFFPQSEILYSCYQKANKTSIEPAALKDAPFAIFGVRPCDVRAFDVLDRVFLSEPADVTMQQEESTASLFPWLVMSRKTAASVKPSASMLQNRQQMLLCGR